MPESIQDSIRRLIRYRRAPDRATSVLRQWKHNADILPRLQTQLETLLDAYGKFEPVVYDTQGIHDDGSDIVVRCRPKSEDRSPELICFQIKSFDDLGKKSYLQELKAQRDDSFRKVMRLSQYFIVLCTDSLKHKDRIRHVMAEFRSADRTEVIEPAFALTFLLHPKSRIEAVVTRSMQADDYVFKSALESLQDMFTPYARALAVYMVVNWVLWGTVLFTVENLISSEELRKTYGELQQDELLEMENDPEGELYRPYDFEEQIAEDLTILESDVVDLTENLQEFRLNPGRLRSLIALASDSLARYEYDKGQLMDYMFNLMGVRD